LAAKIACAKCTVSLLPQNCLTNWIVKSIGNITGIVGLPDVNACVNVVHHYLPMEKLMD
jgi:hypothetical protein